MKAAAVLLLAALAAACGGRLATPTSPSAPLDAPQSFPSGAFTVTGTVQDAGNGNRLESVRIEVGAGLSAVRLQTDFDGAFSLSGVGGAVTLAVSRSGYTSAIQTLTVNADTSVGIELRRAGPRTTPCGDEPDPSNRILPIFSKPFAGDPLLLNYFDHDLPNQFQDANGFELTACGEAVHGRVDGHEGYDWLMPAGTPLLATTDGTIVAAGPDPPFFCPPLGRSVADQLVVVLRSDGNPAFDAQYLHLSRIDVAPGQHVARGQVIGLSGITGCSTVPHLHFQVRAQGGLNAGALVDPYGWEGSVRDPWALHPLGRASIWLWRPGEAPRLRVQ